MTWVIAVANQKGGVGKTTSVINLAAAFAKIYGIKTLIIDMDPQGHVALSLNIKISGPEDTISAALMGVRLLGDVTFQSYIEDLYVAPSDENLAAVDDQLSRQPGREAVLKAVLAPELARYEMVIIDTPPSLGVLTFNALYAADYVLVPIQPRLFSIEGLKRLYHIIELLRARLGGRTEILGHFLTMVDNRYKVTHEVRADLRSRLGDKLLGVEIPSNVRVEEGHFYRRPSIIYSSEAAASKAYVELASEILRRLHDIKDSSSNTERLKPSRGHGSGL